MVLDIKYFLINKSILLLLIMGLMSVHPFDAEGQRLIERDKILMPLANPNVDLDEGETEWLTQVGGWGAFGNNAFHRNAEHLWYQELGAYAEIYRRGNESSLAITSQIEFIADPSNDINFSPNAIFWEEGLLYSRRYNDFTLQFGYYHRCKHDIDNLESGEERTMVFGSVLGRIVIPATVFRLDDSVFSLQFDHYTITWEDRIPSEFEGVQPNWDELISSLKVNVAWKRPVGTNTKFYLDGYGMGTMLENDFLVNGKFRAELGRSQKAGNLRFGIHVEHLGDSGISVSPNSVTLAGIGVRIMTQGSIAH